MQLLSVHSGRRSSCHVFYQVVDGGTFLAAPTGLGTRPTHDDISSSVTKIETSMSHNS